mgnify:CR=1 FL=1
MTWAPGKGALACASIAFMPGVFVSMGGAVGLYMLIMPKPDGGLYRAGPGCGLYAMCNLGRQPDDVGVRIDGRSKRHEENVA